MQKLLFFICFLVLLIISSACSYRGIAEGMKNTRKMECEKLMEPDRQKCLESTDYSYDDYKKETQKESKTL